jgi:hypothetical protein
VTSTFTLLAGENPAVLSRCNQVLEIKKQFFLGKTTTNEKRDPTSETKRVFETTKMKIPRRISGKTLPDTTMEDNWLVKIARDKSPEARD